MTRNVMHWDKSQRKLVPGPGVPRVDSKPIPGGGDTRGFSLQLPKGYMKDKGATQFTKQGHPMWTTRQGAKDIASRAQDQGDGVVEWDSHGGMTK